MTEATTDLHLRNSTVVDAVAGRFIGARGDLVTEHLVEFGSHTGPFVDLACAVIGAGDFVIDIGAHIGTFTIPMAQQVGGTGRVLAVEPNPITRQMLEINLQLNDLDHVVEATGVAFGAVEQSVGLSVRRSNTGAARIRPLEPDEEPISVVPLDGLIDSGPSFMKIDAEGYELEILLGAASTIERHRPSLLLEIDHRLLGEFDHTPSDVSSFLEPFGYRFFTHIGDRNTSDRGFELREVSDLGAADTTIDVLAVQADVADRLITGLPTAAEGLDDRP